MPSVLDIFMKDASEDMEHLLGCVTEMHHAADNGGDDYKLSRMLRYALAKNKVRIPDTRSTIIDPAKLFRHLATCQNVVQYPETQSFLRRVSQSDKVPQESRAVAAEIVRSAAEETSSESRKPTATVDWFTGTLESLGEDEGFARLVYEDMTEYDSWLSADKLRAAGLVPGDRFFFIMTEDNGQHEIRLVKRPARYTPEARENIMSEIRARARALLRTPEVTHAQPRTDGGQPPPTS